MRPVFFLLAIIFCTVSNAQKKVDLSDKMLVLTTEGAEIALTKATDGTYSFSYQNSMGKGPDLRKIQFRNKKEAEGFISKIGKAFSAKDGESCLLVYPKYKIRLLTEMGVIFMIVNESGQTQSTFRITRDNYNQVNVL
jgi:hypothetical protein